MRRLFRKQQIGLYFGLLSLCCSCVQIQKAEKIRPVIPVQEAKNVEDDSESQINVYVFTPAFRSYQETVKYEAIGSNISSFDQVLNKVKSRARKDGCEALVQVKFYRQAYGNGKLGSSFPKIEAIGVKYTE